MHLNLIFLIMKYIGVIITRPRCRIKNIKLRLLCTLSKILSSLVSEA